MWEGVMLAAWRRVAPFILAVLLVLNLIDAIVVGGRARWLWVAVFAIFIAVALWRRWRAEP
jgi:hypothetical protein